MKSIIRIDGEIGIVPLTRGYEAIIDADDVHLIGLWTWMVLVRGNSFYAGRSSWVDGQNRSECVLMHRLLCPGEHDCVDHLNGNGLDNRRCNLRPASKAQNAWNAAGHADSFTGLKGVTFHRQRNKFVAAICRNGRRKHLGCFDTKEEAHAAYCEAASRLHGEFARFQ